MSDDEAIAEEGPQAEDDLGLGDAAFDEEADAEGASSSDSEGEGEDALQADDYLAARAEGPPPADPLVAAMNQTRRIVELRGGDRHTADVLGANELAGLLAARAAQIDAEGLFFGVEARPGDDAVSLARRELQARACPLVIRRLVGRRLQRGEDGELALYEYVEIWSPNELAHPPS